MMNNEFTCPICSTPLFHGIRLRNNEYVVYCPATSSHGYIEGTGGNVTEAMENMEKKTKQKQEGLI